MRQTSPQAPRGVSRLGFIVRLVALALLLTGLYFLGDTATHQVRDWLAPLQDHGLALLVVAMALYVIFMAIPFVPGIEVGLMVMLVGGVEGIAVVYIATLLALSLSYALGRLVPPPMLVGLLGWLGLHRAAALIHELEAMTGQQRLVHLSRRLPNRWLPFFLRHRYLAVAIVINTPGNAVIGGGGGIGLIAGLSGLFPFPRYLALMALAILPVPLVLIGNAHF